jgi:hypothetical protein
LRGLGETELIVYQAFSLGVEVPIVADIHSTEQLPYIVAVHNSIDHHYDGAK